MISLQKSALSSMSWIPTRRKSNKSLDASGGSVFLNLLGAAEECVDSRRRVNSNVKPQEEWCTSDRATDWTNMKPQKRLDYLCSLREEIAALRVCEVPYVT